MSGLVQVVIAVGIGAAVWMSGRWVIKVLSQPGPDEPDQEAVVDVEASFRC